MVALKPKNEVRKILHFFVYLLVFRRTKKYRKCGLDVESQLLVEYRAVINPSSYFVKIYN
jgi:hypothetical protein